MADSVIRGNRIQHKLGVRPVLSGVVQVQVHLPGWNGEIDKHRSKCAHRARWASQ